MVRLRRVTSHEPGWTRGRASWFRPPRCGRGTASRGRRAEDPRARRPAGLAGRVDPRCWLRRPSPRVTSPARPVLDPRATAGSGRHFVPDPHAESRAGIPSTAVGTYLHGKPHVSRPGAPCCQRLSPRRAVGRDAVPSTGLTVDALSGWGGGRMQGTPTYVVGSVIVDVQDGDRVQPGDLAGGEVDHDRRVRRDGVQPGWSRPLETISSPLTCSR